MDKGNPNDRSSPHPSCPPGLNINPSSRRKVSSVHCLHVTLATQKRRPFPSPPPVATLPSELRTSSPSSNSRLNLRRDLRTGRHSRYPDSAYRPDSSLRAAEGPAGNTSAAEVARTVLQEGRTGLVVAHSRGLVGMGWASRSSHCWAGPAGMAACRPGCRDRHLGERVAATEGTAAVRPLSKSVTCSQAMLAMMPAETCGADGVEDARCYATALLVHLSWEETYVLLVGVHSGVL